MSDDVTVLELDRLGELRPGERAVVAGRALRCEDGELLLVGQRGAAKLPLGRGLTPPSPGDHVRAEVVGQGGSEGPRAEALEVLTPYRLERPFPSPGGEYYRLHGGDPSRAKLLALRSRVLGAIRAFFHERGYLEVETPRLVRHPGLEPHLRPLSAGPDEHLITSPEYQMKRLLAGGLERIYNMGPCWRGDEVGRHHLREFTMLEWYRAHCSLEELMEETEALVARVALEAAGQVSTRFGGQALDLAPPFARFSVAGACLEYGRVDLAGVVEAGELARRCRGQGLDLPMEGLTYEDIFSQLMVERVEPALAALHQPVVLYDFPAPLAALSRLRDDDPTVARRFELYAGGLELANAFFELTDPAEQRRRLEGDQAQRRQAGQEAFALDERFLDALAEGMPPAAGIALGVDRLVMLLAGEPDIRKVVAFAPEEV